MKYHDVKKKFASENCTYRFCSNLSLTKHKIRRHGFKMSSVKIHECNICDYTTIYENLLKIHLLQHAGANLMSAVDMLLQMCMSR